MKHINGKMGTNNNTTSILAKLNYSNKAIRPILDENIFYESPSNPFESLCETTFLKEILDNFKYQMKEKFYEYNFYIYSSTWNKNILPQSANHKTEKKKILLYISDESGEIPYNLAPHYYCIFKMYLQTDQFSVDNIFNFPLGCEKHIPKLAYKSINDRKYSVFFSGNLYSGRLPLFYSLAFNKKPNVIVTNGLKIFLGSKFLKKRLTSLKFDSRFPDSFIRFTDGFKQGLPPEIYGEIMADSKIILCPKGFYFSECFRHYEAMRAGCVIISEELPQTYFYKDSPIIQVSNWEEGLKKARELLNNQKELEKLSKSTLNWWSKKCSGDATALYMKNCLTPLENRN